MLHRRMTSGSGFAVPRVIRSLLAVVALGVLAAGCRLTEPTLAQFATLDMFSTAPASATFFYGPDAAQRIDLHRPPSSFGPGPHPAIIFLPGGAWTTDSPPFVDPIMTTQLRRGWVVLSATYRSATRAPWPAQAHDIDRMMRWVRQHARDLDVDPNMIVLSGHSAGGHLALMNGLGSGSFVDPDLDLGLLPYSPRPQAVVAISAPTNLSDLKFYIYDEISSAKIINTLLGCREPPPHVLSRVTCRHLKLRVASPIAHVSADDPPVYIAQGDLDTIVNKRQAIALHARLCGVGRCETTWLDMINRYVDDTGAILSLPDRDRGHHPGVKIDLWALELFLDGVRYGQLR